VAGCFWSRSGPQQKCTLAFPNSIHVAAGTRKGKPFHGYIARFSVCDF
jgi:hypothetical protein